MKNVHTPATAGKKIPRARKMYQDDIDWLRRFIKDAEKSDTPVRIAMLRELGEEVILSDADVKWACEFEPQSAAVCLRQLHTYIDAANHFHAFEAMLGELVEGEQSLLWFDGVAVSRVAHFARFLGKELRSFQHGLAQSVGHFTAQNRLLSIERRFQTTAAQKAAAQEGALQKCEKTPDFVVTPNSAQASRAPDKMSIG